MADDSWKTHILYLEGEVTKLVERANKLEGMVPGLESEQKKHALRELVGRLRNEVNEYRKYLAVVKPK
jgi:hypothetical protein